MGCGTSSKLNNLDYSQPVGPNDSQNETEVRRNPKFVQELITQTLENIKTLQDALQGSVTKFGKENFLGTCRNDAYQFITYDQAFEQIRYLGSGQASFIIQNYHRILNLNLTQNQNDYLNLQLKLFGVLSKNREEWFLLDLACIMYGIQIIPFCTTQGFDSIPIILEETQITTLFCSKEYINTIQQIPKYELAKLQYIILLDPLNQFEENKLKQKGLKLIPYADVIKQGKENIHKFETISPNDIYTISYTSGTVGNPLGTILTHGNIIAAIDGILNSNLAIMNKDVHISYLPISQIYDRVVCLTIMTVGGQIGFISRFSSADLNQLQNDLTRLKPTFFISVPRIYKKIYQLIIDRIEALQPQEKQIITMSIEKKLEGLRKKGALSNVLYDKVISELNSNLQNFSFIKNFFGGQIKFLVTGSAPLSKDIIDFLKITTCCPLYEGYGLTEAAGVSFITYRQDTTCGHIGGPTACTEFKLVNVPQMNYTCKDTDPTGRVTPRGELCIRGPSVFLGYYKNPEKTSESKDVDNWLHTGDIAMILHNGAIQLIDRKKNYFKLSQGVFISPERVESVYSRAKGVNEIFVYGDPYENFCVAVVVPEEQYVDQLIKELKIEKSEKSEFSELVKKEEIQKKILENMKSFGKEHGLTGLEQVKKIYLEHQSFPSLGLTTRTYELIRSLAKQKFYEKLKTLYSK